MNALPLLLLSMSLALPGETETWPSLKPADAPPNHATLTVRNETATEAAAVALRWKSGGPRWIVPLPLAPDQKTELSIALPPAALEQVWKIQLLAADRPDAMVLSETQAEISWPVQQVQPNCLRDPFAYDSVRDDFPIWPGRLRRDVFLLAAMTGLLLCGACLLRKSALRAAVVILLAAAGASGGYWLLGRCETLLIEDRGPTLLFRCRRTSLVQWSDPDSRLLPIYQTRRQMETDTLTLHPHRGASFTLQPDEIRLFRVLK